MATLLPAKGAAAIPEVVSVGQHDSQLAGQQEVQVPAQPANWQAAQLPPQMSDKPADSIPLQGIEQMPSGQPASAQASQQPPLLASQNAHHLPEQPALQSVNVQDVQGAHLPVVQQSEQSASQEANGPANQQDRSLPSFAARFRSGKESEARTTVSARLPLSLQRRLREYSHRAEMQKQDVIEAALEEFLTREGF